MFRLCSTATRDYDNECFICYEYLTETYATPLRLQTQQMYDRCCGCKGSVHLSCLQTWVNAHHTCPVCRAKMSATAKASATTIKHFTTLMIVYACLILANVCTLTCLVLTAYKLPHVV